MSMLAMGNSSRYSRSRFLVRWLSGRKQRFAKAPYPKRVPRVRIPPSPFPSYVGGASRQSNNLGNNMTQSEMISTSKQDAPLCAGRSANQNKFLDGNAR